MLRITVIVMKRNVVGISSALFEISAFATHLCTPCSSLLFSISSSGFLRLCCPTRTIVYSPFYETYHHSMRLICIDVNIRPLLSIAFIFLRPRIIIFYKIIFDRLCAQDFSILPSRSAPFSLSEL